MVTNEITITENNDTTYQSKAAIQYTTRVELKQKAHSEVKPSVQEKKNYNVLLAKLQTLVFSTKHKFDIKELETSHYCTQGTLPNRNDHLRKKLDYIRKLLNKFNL